MKKGMILGKRQMILAVLVLALSAAIYLNWQFASKEGGLNITGDLSSSKYMGDAAYVNNPKTESTPQESDSYFTTARSDRKKARDEAIAELKDITDDVKTDAAAKKAAGEQATKIAKNVETESAMETLIKAKGFADCVVVMGDDEVNVIVKAESLLDSQTVQIYDIVSAQTKISVEKIKIIKVK